MRRRGNSLQAVLWWAGYTIAGVWVHKTVPGIDVFAPGIVLSMQEQGGFRTFWLGFVWILVLEGMGNLPFGYGVAWYSMLVAFFIAGRWLFEARSILFMCVIGLGLGVLHPALTWFVCMLGGIAFPMREAVLEGVLQAVVFPIAWVFADKLFPRGLRQDVAPL